MNKKNLLQYAIHNIYMASVRLALFFAKLISNAIYAPISKVFKTASASYLGFASKNV